MNAAQDTEAEADAKTDIAAHDPGAEICVCQHRRDMHSQIDRVCHAACLGIGRCDCAEFRPEVRHGQ